MFFAIDRELPYKGDLKHRFDCTYNCYSFATSRGILTHQQQNNSFFPIYHLIYRNNLYFYLDILLQICCLWKKIIKYIVYMTFCIKFKLKFKCDKNNFMDRNLIFITILKLVDYESHMRLRVT